MPSLAPCRSVLLAFWIVCPPSSTCSPGGSGARAVLITPQHRVTREADRAAVELTVPKAVRPSGAIAMGAPARGGA
jgi:hypothetical protein